jgi:cytochrome b pre-mRNA-processing protein 3
MSRRIRNMADAFYGRIDSYGSAAGPGDLSTAIQRNLYRGSPERGREAEGLASYMMEARASLGRGLGPLLEGMPDFGPLPRLDRI